MTFILHTVTIRLQVLNHLLVSKPEILDGFSPLLILSCWLSLKPLATGFKTIILQATCMYVVNEPHRVWLEKNHPFLVFYRTNLYF